MLIQEDNVFNRACKQLSLQPLSAVREQKSKPWRSLTAGQWQLSYTNRSLRSHASDHCWEDVLEDAAEQNRDGLGGIFLEANECSSLFSTSCIQGPFELIFRSSAWIFFTALLCSSCFA